MDTKKITGYIAAGLIGAGVAFGGCYLFLDKSDDSTEAVIKEINEILTEADYPMKEKNDTAILKGYVKAIASDPYTYYYVSDEVADMTDYVNAAGTAVASGFQVDKAEDGNILLTEIKPGLAADEQGLKVGDVITAIDGVSVLEKGYENIVNKMLGKEGTTVTLSVIRDEKNFDIEFVRSHKQVNTVEFENLDGIAYIYIRGFEKTAEGQLSQALESAQECSKIIVDLRGNRGGNTELCAQWASLMFGHSKVTVHMFNGEEQTYEFENPSKLGGKEIVTLVDSDTASSGEIMTAFTKQEADAVLVGTNTFGKGISQTVAELSNGGYLRYTGGTFTVGDWECWQGVGIAPDVEIPMDSELIGTDDDIQLKKALELLN